MRVTPRQIVPDPHAILISRQTITFLFIKKLSEDIAAIPPAPEMIRAITALLSLLLTPG